MVIPSYLSNEKGPLVVYGLKKGDEILRSYIRDYFITHEIRIPFRGSPLYEGER